jgi:hypothetical protein
MRKQMLDDCDLRELDPKYGGPVPSQPVFDVEDLAVVEAAQKFWDDISGEQLPSPLVQAARKEEMTFVKGIPVYKEVEVKECWDRTGKGPVSTKWVDVEKKEMGKLMVRSRWVARDFKGRGEEDREDLFAATPPLEAKKLLFKWVRRLKADGKRNLEKVR